MLSRLGWKVQAYKIKNALAGTRHKLLPKAEQVKYSTYLAIYEFEGSKACQEFWSSPMLAAGREEMK